MADETIMTARSEMGSCRWPFASLCVGLLILFTSVQSLSAISIAVREVGGAPVVRCKVRYGDAVIDVHAIVDVNLKVPLAIHSQSIGGLGLSPMFAIGKRVDLEFSAAATLKGVPVHITEDKLLANMTRLHANALHQVPVVALIGLKAFQENVIELDMQRGLLRALEMASDEARSREMDYELAPSGVLLSGMGPADTPVQALLSTKRLDSRMSLALLEKTRESGERVIRLEIGDTDFGKYTAFRFVPKVVVDDPTGTVVVLGLDAIRNQAVTIWPNRQKISFIQRGEVPYPRTEQAYFYSLADKNPAGISTFIDTHKRHRLLDEALINLWKIRSEDMSAATGELKSILNKVAQKYDKERQALALSQVSDALEAGERPDRDVLSLYALELAMAQSDGALDSSTVHTVLLRLGKKAYAAGDLKLARRHLLSAAFGLPKDAECNFWLAEVYREMGKTRRAWSRYYQAIIDVNAEDGIRARAVARIELLNADPAFRETFTMLAAEQYTSGRSAMGEFHAPYRYELEQSRFSGHVRLVESFVNSSDPRMASQQMALSGINEYFQCDVALIEYHVGDRLHSSVAVNRLAYYNKTNLPLVALDGEPKPIRFGEPMKDDPIAKAKSHYRALKAECLLDSPGTNTGWILEADMDRNAQTLSGAVRVSGNDEDENVRLHVMLCERSVMAIQGNGILFHRFVARAALTPSEGIPVRKAVEQALDFNVDADVMAKNLGIDGAYIDARLLMVVAFLQRDTDQKVLSAESFALPLEDGIL